MSYKGAVNMRFPPFNPYVAIVIGVISVSSFAILVYLVGDAPAGVIAFYRFFLSVIIMAPFVLFKYQNEIIQMFKRNWVLAILSSVFLAFHFIFSFESLNLTSVASSVTLVAMHPIFASIGTYFFFGERFSVAAFISLFITIVVSCIISMADFLVSGLAFFRALLALIGAASFS